MFQNRLSEQGTLGFRDTTGSAYPVGYSTGDGHYEQEMGDQDGDGDLDIYGLNWQVVIVQGFPNFWDIVLKNQGNGTFGNAAQLPGSQSDDNEGYTSGWDHDTIRFTHPSYPPAQDTNNGAGWGEQKFGSSHSSTFMVVFADGSVRGLSFSINPTTFSQLGNIADGQVPSDY